MKHRVLVAEDDPDLRELVKFYIEAEFNNVEVLTVNSALSAIKLVRENPAFSAIICDFNMRTDNGGVLFQYLQKERIDIPFVLFSSDSLSDHPEIQGRPLLGYVEKTKVAQDLKGLLSQALVSSDDPFIGVSYEILLRIGVLPCDIYLKLSTHKFVKICHKGEFFNLDDKEKFVSKKVDKLWIFRQAMEDFTECFLATFHSLGEAKLSPSSQPIGPLQVGIQETMQMWVEELGFSPYVEAIAKNHVQMALNLLHANKELDTMIQSLKLSPKSYFTEHAIMLPYICSYIANLMGWGSEHTLHKLTLASFLHDTKIGDHSLAKYKTLKEAQEAGATPVQIAAISKHPALAADLVKQFREVPPDVDIIIAQHHEAADGSGFPNGHNHSKLSPLSVVFIVAQDMIDFQMKHGRLHLENFLSSVETLYEFGHFRKIAQALALKLSALKEK